MKKTQKIFNKRFLKEFAKWCQIDKEVLIYKKVLKCSFLKKKIHSITRQHSISSDFLSFLQFVYTKGKTCWFFFFFFFLLVFPKHKVRTPLYLVLHFILLNPFFLWKWNQAWLSHSTIFCGNQWKEIDLLLSSKSGHISWYLKYLNLYYVLNTDINPHKYSVLIHHFLILLIISFCAFNYGLNPWINWIMLNEHHKFKLQCTWM